MTALDVHDLRVGYGSVQVLSGLSITVSAGRSVALLGPNGAGKTTFVLALAGLLKARSGEVTMFDERLDSYRPARRVRAGLITVTQDRDLFRDLTVLDNLELGHRARAGRTGWSLEDVFELFPPLFTKKGESAGSLSGGQQQMLAIARGLLGCPRVLVLDEPSAGLSQGVLDDVTDALQTLRTEGQSMLVVEQRLDMALKLCDDYVVISGGQKVLEDQVANTDLDRLEAEYFAREAGGGS